MSGLAEETRQGKMPGLLELWRRRRKEKMSTLTGEKFRGITCNRDGHFPFSCELLCDLRESGQAGSVA